MFTPFSRPLARALPLGFVIIAVLTAAGRFLILDGDAWNWGAAGATLAVCAVGASHWSALRQLDVSPLAWFRSALATLAVWSVALSAVITAAANLMQANSPYYRLYDRFLATSGDYHHVGTDGEPYVLEGFGVTAGSITATFLIVLLVLLTAGVVGLAVGLSGGQRGLTAAVLIAAVVLTFIIVFAAGIWTVALMTDPRHHLLRCGVTLATCAPLALTSLWLTRRALRS